MKNDQLKYLLSAFFALSVILASCSQVQRSVKTEQPTTAVEAISSPESAVTTDTQMNAVEENEPEPIEATEESTEKPTPRSGLVATDPSTVTLASGEIQLVEFFAFW